MTASQLAGDIAGVVGLVVPDEALDGALDEDADDLAVDGAELDERRNGVGLVGVDVEDGRRAA